MKHTKTLKSFNMKSTQTNKLTSYLLNFYKLILNILFEKNLTNVNVFFSYEIILLNNLLKNKKTSYRRTFLSSQIKVKKNYNPTCNLKEIFHQKNNLKLFKTFLCFSENNFQFFFKPHYKYNLFFNCVTRENTVSINLFKYFNKWNNTYSLLSSLFFYNLSICSFGNRLIWQETTLINWDCFKNTTQPYLKHYTPIFFTNFNTPKLIEKVFKPFNVSNQPIVFILDITKHNYNIKFFQKKKLFTLGLVPINYDPWLLNYPVPIFNQNLLIQYYFIKLYFKIKHNAKKIIFSNLKKMWHSSLLIN